jgi:calpain, invertebrate
MKLCSKSYSQNIHMLSATFWTNPQYQVTVVDPDPDDNDGTGSLIIGLMQKDRRKLRRQGLNELTLGYAVYKVCTNI